MDNVQLVEKAGAADAEFRVEAVGAAMLGAHLLTTHTIIEATEFIRPDRQLPEL
jgi:hypothetical protein